MKKRPFFVPKVPRVPAVLFLDVDLVPQDDPIYIPPPAETDEEMELRVGREYDEENDPDPWGDLDGSDCDHELDQVEDWEMLGMDADSTQEEIDDMWENQM